MPLPPVTGSHFIVCGDNPLAYRIARELTDRYGQYVVVLLADKLRNHGPQIAALPGVIVREHAGADQRGARGRGRRHRPGHGPGGPR